jgi:diacylglycerol O-acyltransferase / trehalose O-mycolyltransferase
MRKLVALIAVALAVAGCGGEQPRAGAPPKPSAEVVGEQQVGPRQLDLTVRSPAVGAEVKARLLTPDDWSRGARRRWPVLYLLHGCCDSYESWTRSTDIEEIAALRDVLVVMPDGGEVGFYSDWLDGPRWETFHLRELPRILERRYGAGRRRAIAGLSMGGLGAILYAARSPRRFRAAASFSGVLHPAASPGLLDLFAAYTTDPRAIWGDPEADRDVWRRHDPTVLAPALRGLSLYVSSGDGRPGPLDDPDAGRDAIEADVNGQSRAFSDRLRRLRIPAVRRFYGPGRHHWPYWERELKRALPLLLGPIS